MGKSPPTPARSLHREISVFHESFRDALDCLKGTRALQLVTACVHAACAHAHIHIHDQYHSHTRGKAEFSFSALCGHRFFLLVIIDLPSAVLSSSSVLSASAPPPESHFSPFFILPFPRQQWKNISPSRTQPMADAVVWASGAGGLPSVHASSQDL